MYNFAKHRKLLRIMARRSGEISTIILPFRDKLFGMFIIIIKKKPSVKKPGRHHLNQTIKLTLHHGIC